MAKVKELCEQNLRPVIEKQGYELLEVTYQKENGEMTLLLTIDCEKGVTIDDCEKVTKLIDPILDELNPTDDKPYILSVSSPGLDRPIKTERDFLRNQGKEVELTLFKKLDGKKKFAGILKSFSNEMVELEINGQSQKFSKSLIAHIVPIIKF